APARATSAARAATPPETPPRRDRGCGNSATARRRPGDGPTSVPRRSRPCRSCAQGSRAEELQRTNLIGAGARVHGSELARRLDRGVERGAIDDEEAEELLLGFGERAVDDERLLAAPAQRRRRRRRQEARDRTEPPLFGPLLLHRAHLRHHTVVLLLAP